MFEKNKIMISHLLLLSVLPTKPEGPYHNSVVSDMASPTGTGQHGVITGHKTPDSQGSSSRSNDLDDNNFSLHNLANLHKERFIGEHVEPWANYKQAKGTKSDILQILEKSKYVRQTQHRNNSKCSLSIQQVHQRGRHHG